MPNRIETIQQTYRGHTYELTLTHTQTKASLTGGHLAKAGVVVDGQRVYAGTPGFALGGLTAADVGAADVHEAVTRYIDFLEIDFLEQPTP